MRKNKIRILHVAQAAGGVDRYIRMLLKYLDAISMTYNLHDGEENNDLIVERIRKSSRL